MRITIKDDTSIHDVSDALYNLRNNFRFTFEWEFVGNGIKIKNVRLRDKKLYCGNHPAECEVNFAGVEPRQRMGPWLEGLDWVEFNDRINDILDELNTSANVFTSVCKIRKDTRRRIFYGYHRLAFNTEWNKDEDDSCYEDWCGKEAPASEYPFGTPGLYKR